MTLKTRQRPYRKDSDKLYKRQPKHRRSMPNFNYKEELANGNGVNGGGPRKEVPIDYEGTFKVRIGAITEKIANQGGIKYGIPFIIEAGNTRMPESGKTFSGIPITKNSTMFQRGSWPGSVKPLALPMKCLIGRLNLKAGNLPSR